MRLFLDRVREGLSALPPYCRRRIRKIASGGLAAGHWPPNDCHTPTTSGSRASVFGRGQFFRRRARRAAGDRKSALELGSFFLRLALVPFSQNIGVGSAGDCGGDSSCRFQRLHPAIWLCSAKRANGRGTIGTVLLPGNARPSVRLGTAALSRRCFAVFSRAASMGRRRKCHLWGQCAVLRHTRSILPGRVPGLRGAAAGSSPGGSLPNSLQRPAADRAEAAGACASSDANGSARIQPARQLSAAFSSEFPTGFRDG